MNENQSLRYAHSFPLAIATATAGITPTRFTCYNNALPQQNNKDVRTQRQDYPHPLVALALMSMTWRNLSSTIAMIRAVPSACST